jgi:hypothetical protein
LLVWSRFKEALSKSVGLSHDALHVHVGLALFLLLALLLRRYRWGVPAALGVVLALELGNEVSDAFDWVRWTGAPNFIESGRDIASTMFWPVVLAVGLAVWRRKKARVDGPSRAVADNGPPPV